MLLEDLKKEIRKENLNRLREEINSKWLFDKIKAHLERNPFLEESEEQIKERLMRDDLLASFFIKDPNKQNITEKHIGKIISKMELVENFQNLPSSTSLFISNGEITDKKQQDNLKSIDYIWETRGKKIYASQKYTNEKGGAQDNQKNDIITFLINALESEHEDVFFFAIVDGYYFDDEFVSFLREKYKGNNVKICRTEELEEYLEKI